MIVAEPVAAAAVEAVIRRSAGPLLVDLRLFDIYRGAPLAAGEKSLAERLVLRSADRTLTDPEVEAIVAGVTAALSAELERASGRDHRPGCDAEGHALPLRRLAGPAPREGS